MASAEPGGRAAEGLGAEVVGGLPEAEVNKCYRHLTAAGLSSVSGNIEAVAPGPWGSHGLGEARPVTPPQVPRLLSAPPQRPSPSFLHPSLAPSGQRNQALRCLDGRTHLVPTWSSPLALPPSTGTYAPLRKTLCWLRGKGCSPHRGGQPGADD